MNFNGVVSKVSDFEYQGKKLYSFQLNGDRTFYRTGNIRPKVEAGQYITFIANEGKNGSFNVDTKSIEVRQGEQQSSGIPAGALGTGNRKSSDTEELSPQNDRRYETKADRDARNERIERQSCRNSALEFIKILLQHEGVKVPAKNKTEFFEELLSHYQSKFMDDNQGLESTVPVNNPVGADTGDYS